MRSFIQAIIECIAMSKQLSDRGVCQSLDANGTKWLRASTPAQRIEMVSALNEMGRRIIADGIRDGPPDLNDAQISAEVGRRLLTDENLPELYAKDLSYVEPFATAYRSACSLDVSNSGVAGSDDACRSL